MSKIEELIKDFKENTKNKTDMETVLTALEYGKIIDEQFTKEDKNNFINELVNNMSNEDIEKAKSLMQMMNK